MLDGAHPREETRVLLLPVLVWVFYSAQIFLHGAEFTWLYDHSDGSRAASRAARL